ncbi:hypothetical protein A4X06_0g7340 [Tilletia controversa]|uniref:Uncharacterized protein n=1 Tax=Tilletia controversa TaxID=13291 RepID=A0A8X7SU75_9BASI|nr:hypothetical protein CF336_g9014 [Tilletia laevis]KAE8185620.1 hypothetical protein CF328_g7488 [Tilletia controversa]KAE8241948.1 hypothetical protein A4X06_0g7340 [Tilletia controversa]
MAHISSSPVTTSPFSSVPGSNSSGHTVVCTPPTHSSPFRERGRNTSDESGAGITISNDSRHQHSMATYDHPLVTFPLGRQSTQPTGGFITEEQGPPRGRAAAPTTSTTIPSSPTYESATPSSTLDLYSHNTQHILQEPLSRHHNAPSHTPHSARAHALDPLVLGIWPCTPTQWRS